MKDNLCKEIREQLGITQAEFSRIFNVPVRTVQNWEYRKNMPLYYYYALEKIIMQQCEIEELKDDLKVLAKSFKNFKNQC